MLYQKVNLLWEVPTLISEDIDRNIKYLQSVGAITKTKYQDSYWVKMDKGDTLGKGKISLTNLNTLIRVKNARGLHWLDYKRTQKEL